MGRKSIRTIAFILLLGSGNGRLRAGIFVGIAMRRLELRCRQSSSHKSTKPSQMDENW
jgi:hypothetical protein